MSTITLIICSLGIVFNTRAIVCLRKNKKNINIELKKSGYFEIEQEFIDQIKTYALSILKFIVPYYYDIKYNILSQKVLSTTCDRAVLKKLDKGKLRKKQILIDEDEFRNKKEQLIDTVTPHKARKIYDEYGDIKYDISSPIDLAGISPFVEEEKEELTQVASIDEVKDEEVSEDTIISADLSEVIKLRDRINSIIDYRKHKEQVELKTEAILKRDKNNKVKDKIAA